MKHRWMAVALGAAALAVPATALAGHGHGHGDGVKDKASKDKKAVTFVFKGVYEGEGVVAVAKGNAHVRKAGYVGTAVAFDMSAAKLVVADTDGVAGITADDLQAGDKLLVQARLPRGSKAPEVEGAPAAEAEDEAPAVIKARKVVDKTHPPVD